MMPFSASFTRLCKVSRPDTEDVVASSSAAAVVVMSCWRLFSPLSCVASPLRDAAADDEEEAEVECFGAEDAAAGPLPLDLVVVAVAVGATFASENFVFRLDFVLLGCVLVSRFCKVSPAFPPPVVDDIFP